MKKPLPDLPTTDNTLALHAELLDSTTVSPHVSRRYFIQFAYLLAALLTFIGACSDGAQKLFGSGQAFGIDDLTLEMSHATDTLSQFGIAYLLIGAVAAVIQSISLEKTFTQNFIFDLFRLSTAELEDPEVTVLQEHNLFAASLNLAWYETLSLGLIRVSGAAVRGISSIMGYRTISNNLSLGFIITPSLVDAGQTLATEGVYLKNQYLLLRLKLKSKVFPNRYDAAFLTAMRTLIDNDDYTCHSKRGIALYLSCLAVGTLAVLGDIGLAKLVLDSFAQDNNFDTESLGFRLPQIIGLTSLFLLISVIDSKSLADYITRRFEQPTLIETPVAIHSPTTHPLLMGVAGLISLLGASITALGAYEGNRYLLTQLNIGTDSIAVALSTLVAILKGCQSLAVEGCYTLKAAATSQWRPSCSALNRLMSAFSTVCHKDQRDVTPIFAAAQGHPYTTLV